MVESSSVQNSACCHLLAITAMTKVCPFGVALSLPGAERGEEESHLLAGSRRVYGDIREKYGNLEDEEGRTRGPRVRRAKLWRWRHAPLMMLVWATHPDTPVWGPSPAFCIHHWNIFKKIKYIKSFDIGYGWFWALDLSP